MRLQSLLWTALVFVVCAGGTQAHAATGAWGGSSGYGYGWCGGSNGIPYSTGCSGPGFGYNSRYCGCGSCNGYGSGYWGGTRSASWVAVYGGAGYAPAGYSNGAAAPQAVTPEPQGVTPPPPPALPPSAARPMIPTEKVSISKLLKSQR